MLYTLQILLFLNLISCKGGGDGGSEDESKIQTTTPTAEIKSEKNKTLSITEEPLFKYLWFIKNEGTKGLFKNEGLKSQDVNYPPDYLTGSSSELLTGKGIKIAVSDTGVEIAHEDLKDNVIKGNRSYRRRLSEHWSYDDNPTPLNSDGSNHGTAVAGLIAASKNGKGIVGVASGAGIVGFKYIGMESSSDKKVDQAKGDFDIFNYSYGGMPCSFKLNYDENFINQLAYGTKNQRNGKGSSYVKAAGNEYSGTLFDCFIGPESILDVPYFGNSAMEEDQNYPYYVLVGALNAKGKRASYSTPGPNIWISAPGGDKGDDPRVVTTSMSNCNSPDMNDRIKYYYYNIYDGDLEYNQFDNLYRDTVLEIYTEARLLNKFDWNNKDLNPLCKYTASLMGTSFAAPIVSGAIALILEANPDLNWRQVKHILAATSRKVDDSEGESLRLREKVDLDSNTLSKWDSPKIHPGIDDFKDYEVNFNLPSDTPYRQAWIYRGVSGLIYPYFYHNWYGFGALDIKAATQMALESKKKAWKNVDRVGVMLDLDKSPLIQTINPNTKEWYYQKSFQNIKLKKGDKFGDPLDLNPNDTDIQVVHSMRIEAVQVKLTIENDSAENYRVDLCQGSSNNDICHTLLNPKSGIQGKLEDKTLLSNAFYGHKTTGSWSLVIRKVEGENEGKLINWKINFFGHRSSKSKILDGAFNAAVEDLKSEYNKNADGWEIDVSWDTPEVGGNNTNLNPYYKSSDWKLVSSYVMKKTDKQGIVCLSFNVENSYDIYDSGYRLEFSIGTLPGKDDVYKWGLIPSWQSYELVQTVATGSNRYYECRQPSFKIKKGMGFSPKPSKDYFINIRDIKTKHDFDYKREEEPVSVKWTSPSDVGQ
ncbi:S8 family serine peptidase [Bacteriovoracales bacterium]|nr:S8 family serine peptidase [Bacteriovoracales bacterium]